MYMTCMGIYVCACEGQELMSDVFFGCPLFNDTRFSLTPEIFTSPASPRHLLPLSSECWDQDGTPYPLGFSMGAGTLYYSPLVCTASVLSSESVISLATLPMLKFSYMFWRFTVLDCCPLPDIFTYTNFLLSSSFPLLTVLPEALMLQFSQSSVYGLFPVFLVSHWRNPYHSQCCQFLLYCSWIWWRLILIPALGKQQKRDLY